MVATRQNAASRCRCVRGFAADASARSLIAVSLQCKSSTLPNNVGNGALPIHACRCSCEASRQTQLLLLRGGKSSAERISYPASSHDSKLSSPCSSSLDPCMSAGSRVDRGDRPAAEASLAPRFHSTPSTVTLTKWVPPLAARLVLALVLELPPVPTPSPQASRRAPGSRDNSEAERWAPTVVSSE